MPSITTPLSKVLRTTPFHLRRLKELGVETVQDFLSYFPRRYTDQREVRPILEIQIDATNTIRGRIQSLKRLPRFKRRFPLLTMLINDENASIESIWFNQSYLEKYVNVGDEVMLSGKVKYDQKRGAAIFQNPSIEKIKPKQIHTARIVPVYRETDIDAPAWARYARGKISSKWIREKLFPLLPWTQYFPEFLPQEIQKTFHLIPLGQAIRQVHFPESEKPLEQAKKRLAFDELFCLQIAALSRRNKFRKIAEREKKQILPDWDLIKKFTQSLPWPLTSAQKKAIYEILQDLAKQFPMSRLLEGDTGSGKTIVATAAVLQVIKRGFQACLMAPTEILARQHFQTFSKCLKTFDIEAKLLVGSLTEQEKCSIRELLKNGDIPLVIGTHALLQETVAFKNLGLTIIDEQHRFGVRQRELIKNYGSPHVLSLTATPIPRTLALIIYGDQDLSVLDEMPPGRQKIITRVVPEEKRREAYEWIEKEIEQGRQAFIIFPLIEESMVLEVKAATREFERLSREVFPRLKLGLLHGQLPPKEKAQTMENFSAGKIQVLISTAVVEVGVDVPNATIMMIEGAERFGLAQLHQFRGRVGRGAEKSYCFLFPTQATQQNMKRLLALVKYDCGFRLAEIDLELRGPGEVYGTRQSGIPDLKMANLSDVVTIKQSREAAEMILEKDPELKNYPILKQKINEQESIAIDY